MKEEEAERESEREREREREMRFGYKPHSRAQCHSQALVCVSGTIRHKGHIRTLA